jgi:hypothetical protein
MRTAAILFFGFSLVLSGQETDKGPPRLKRGQPKATDKRGEASPEQKPVPIREVVTDADGKVVSESGQPSTAREPGSPPPVREVVSDSSGNVVSERGLAAPSSRSGNPVDETIEKARQVSLDVQEKIPNFLCDQITLRYEGEGWPKPVWKLKDRITAELMFNDGAESYRNVKTGGKLLGLGKNRPPEETGNWSTGDWMSILLDVVQPSTDAAFKFDKEDTIGGRKTRRYTYTVRQSNSHWRVEPAGYPIKPAYRGAVWIDMETFRVMRVEMEARQLPQNYPLNIVEMTAELGVVNIAGENYLLPVKSENLTCQRDTVTCHRNELQFQKYRRFTAESTISTTDSSVKYEGAEEDAAKKPAAAPANNKKKKK